LTLILSERLLKMTELFEQMTVIPNPTLLFQLNTTFPLKLRPVHCFDSDNSPRLAATLLFSWKKERRNRKGGIRSVTLDLALPFYSLRKQRRSWSSDTTVVSQTQNCSTRTRMERQRQGEREKRGMKREKEGAGPPQNCIHGVWLFQVHLSLLLGAPSSLAEMDYATQRKE